MSGTSGFQEVWSSTSQSLSHRYPFLQKQRHQFGTDSWHLCLAIQILSFLLLWFPCLSSSSHAQVPPPPKPITSSGLNTQVNLSATPPAGTVQYDITGGTRPGGGANLFHSFGEFGVPSNNIANFLNETALPTNNILSRVTGGNISNIFGAIQTEGFGNANLFLMNPAGFLFGPNATVNVGGLMAFTSADYLKLTDNVRFNAIPNVAADALLTALPVASFGFLGSNPGAITVQGSQFSVTDGQRLSLIGGNVTIQSGTLEDGAAQPARLSVPNGTIQLASATSPGEFDATTLQPLPNVIGASFASFGSVTLAPGSTMDLSGIHTVSIRGGQFVLSVHDTVVTTVESAPVADTVMLSPGSSLMTVNASSISDAANVKIVSGTVNIDGAFITTDTQGDGAGGNILVDANTFTLQNGVLSATTSGTNNGGDIQVDATAINLLTFARINTLSFLSDGSAGNIALKATQQITAVDAFLNSDAVGGTGLGGNILLRAPTIGVNGGILSTSTSGTGRAGNILLEGQQISLGASPLGGGLGTDLFASTNFGSGHGGTIILRGLDGPSSQADVTISGNSMLQTLTGADGSGNAGDITINAAQFTLTDHTTLNADTFGSGGAGTITITATDHATVSGLFTTVSSSSDFGATGNAGQITVSAPTVMIGNGGSISTNTTGEGTGGDIKILASQSVTMTNDSSISARSTGPGNAGNILINAGQNYTSTDSAVTTQATAPGTEASGGNITVLATDMVQLTNSQLNASVQGSSTTVGGNITIDPQYVILQQNSQILANATQGQGGNISITTGLLLADATSVIDASSESGLHGTVTIQSPNAPASGKIQPLGKTPLQATSLLNQPCASLAGGEFSSFTVAGRDSLPTEPGSWLTSPLATLNAGMGLGVKAEGVRPVLRDEEPEGETALLSLRQIAPAGFLTHAFAVDSSAGCTS